MEYTKSIGDYYESFEGTPEEIARLIQSLEKHDKNNQGLKHSSPIKGPNITIDTPEPNIGTLGLGEINKRCAEQVNNAFKTIKYNITP